MNDRPNIGAGELPVHSSACERSTTISGVGRKRGFDVDEALEAALSTFWERGYEASSMQVLCAAMEVAPGSAYVAFGGKRELFVAALRLYTETVSAEAVARITSAASGWQGVCDYFDHLVDAMVDGRRRWGCL